MTPTHMFLINKDGKIKQDAIESFETFSKPENIIYTKIEIICLTRAIFSFIFAPENKMKQ